MWIMAMTMGEFWRIRILAHGFCAWEFGYGRWVSYLWLLQI